MQMSDDPRMREWAECGDPTIADVIRTAYEPC
jgi:hypothetical protein